MLISECPFRGRGGEEFSFYIQSEGPPTPAQASAAAIPQQAARPALSGGLSSAPGPPCHCRGNASTSPGAPSVLIGWQHLLSCHLASNWLTVVGASMTSQSVWQQRPCRRSSMVLQQPWWLPAAEGVAAARGLPWALLGEHLATLQIAAGRKYFEQ